MMVVTGLFHGSMVEDPVLVEIVENIGIGLDVGKLSEDMTTGVAQSSLVLVFPEGHAPDINLHIEDGFAVLEFEDMHGNHHSFRLFEVATEEGLEEYYEETEHGSGDSPAAS